MRFGFASVTSLVLALAAGVSADDPKRVPTIDDLLLVKSVGGAQISPDGKWVAYTVNETDFRQDAFVTQIWLANTATGQDVAADARRQVVRQVRSGRPTASGWRSPEPRRRQESDLRDSARRRRGAAVDEVRDGRRRVRVVAGRHAHRLHGNRAAVTGREGSTRRLRRLRSRAPRVHALAHLDVRRRRGDEGARGRHAADEGQGLHRRRRPRGRPTARGSRSARRSIPI